MLLDRLPQLTDLDAQMRILRDPGIRQAPGRRENLLVDHHEGPGFAATFWTWAP